MSDWAPRPPGRTVRLAVVAICAALLGSYSGPTALAIDEITPALPLGMTVNLDTVASGFGSLVELTGAGDGSGDRYAVEQLGRIWRLPADGTAAPELLLDISGRVLDHNERGLLGLAFHPQFDQNGRFFVAYSRRDDGATSISEFTLPGSPELTPDGEAPAKPRPIEQRERPLLVIAQPYTTHKGGSLAFDRDGMLLIGTGDGGSAWDPHHFALDPSALLGKLLRIDVDHGWPYAIPPDNGFADVPGARGEVHAIGLRNPWRFSVDRENGDILIGDVGQDAYEEIDLLQPGEQGISFGWAEMDGLVCLASACGTGSHRLPLIVYPHVDGDVGHCAVIGGYVYRGVAGSLPQGTYLYSDHCSGTIWAASAGQLVAGDSDPVVAARLDPAYGQPQGFGQDDAGELYLLTSTGSILHISEAEGD